MFVQLKCHILTSEKLNIVQGNLNSSNALSNLKLAQLSTHCRVVLMLYTNLHFPSKRIYYLELFLETWFHLELFDLTSCFQQIYISNKIRKFYIVSQFLVFFCKISHRISVNYKNCVSFFEKVRFWAFLIQNIT